MTPKHLLIALALTVTSCTASGQQRSPAAAWSVGYWFWEGSAVTSESNDLPVDTIYFHAGRIEQTERPPREWHVYADLPSRLPRASSYWMVLRYERQRLPSDAVIPLLAERLSAVQAKARAQQIPLAGLQLDIDAPTSSLSDYADFVRQVRKVLPDGMQLSITALLDWFREGTAVSQVINETDEFVPQFYDLSDKRNSANGVYVSLSQAAEIRPIAAKVESAIWSTRFNQFRKRYRIGISSFGRAAIVRGDQLAIYRDLTPLEVGNNPAFTLNTERTTAGEVILKYRAKAKTAISYVTFEPGQLAEFVMPTRESVSEAFTNAKQMGSFCAGVIFFRWPVGNPEIVLQPVEVLSATGSIQTRTTTPRVSARDGGCVAVHCVDLRLLNIDAQANVAVRYKITSTIPFEYFLPDKDLHIRPSGPGELEVTLPPFPATVSLYLGRAVTATPAEFSAAAIRSK